MNRNIIIGIVTAIGLLCFCTVFGGGLFFLLSSSTTPTDVQVTVDAPISVPLNEPYLVSINVQNLTAVSQILDSIDIQNSYLAEIRVEGVDPTYSDSFEIPWVGYQSYTFESTIPANRSIQVDFIMVGLTEGEYSGDVDICINNGSNCITKVVTTEIGTGSGR